MLMGLCSRKYCYCILPFERQFEFLVVHLHLPNRSNLQNTNVCRSLHPQLIRWSFTYDFCCVRFRMCECLSSFKFYVSGLVWVYYNTISPEARWHQALRVRARSPRKQNCALEYLCARGRIGGCDIVPRNDGAGLGSVVKSWKKSWAFFPPAKAARGCRTTPPKNEIERGEKSQLPSRWNRSLPIIIIIIISVVHTHTVG